MILLANIMEGAALFAGAILWWRERNARRLQAFEIQTALIKVRAEAETLKRGAAATASQEALRLRSEMEASFAAAGASHCRPH